MKATAWQIFKWTHGDFLAELEKVECSKFSQSRARDFQVFRYPSRLPGFGHFQVPTNYCPGPRVGSGENQTALDSCRHEYAFGQIDASLLPQVEYTTECRTEMQVYFRSLDAICKQGIATLPPKG
jgi:hypothetical protein